MGNKTEMQPAMQYVAENQTKVRSFEKSGPAKVGGKQPQPTTQGLGMICHPISPITTLIDSFLVIQSLLSLLQ